MVDHATVRSEREVMYIATAGRNCAGVDVRKR
jgi:hypothetical protein